MGRAYCRGRNVSRARSTMGALSPAHLIIILVVALLVLGPGKLPETGAALGHAIRDFRRAVEGKDEEPAPPQIAAGAASAAPSATVAATADTNVDGSAPG